MDWSRVPLLLVTAALLIGGLTDKTTPERSDAMVAVGFTLLGSWATIEIQSWYQRLRGSWEKDKPLTFERDPKPPSNDGQNGV